MRNGPELASFRKKLLGWFRQFQRDLPWRRTSDPYCIWLAEIMLQQTRVTAVIPYYAKFLERFASVQALAAAPQEEVLRLWSGLGYYVRARNLQKAAQQIVEDYGGQFPDKLEEVLALPGIGNYTAAAILSIAFGKTHAVLDGNVARVLARLGAVRGDLQAPLQWEELQTAADSFLDPESPGEWNQAMMELGATLCTPKSPQCLLCPVNDSCEGRRQGIAESLPEKRKKRATLKIELASAVFADKNGWTLLLPPPKDLLYGSPEHSIPALASNLWHFPTVMVNGSPVPALRAYLRRLYPRAGSGGVHLIPAKQIHHAVTYRAITVRPFRIPVKELPRIPGAERAPLQDVTAFPVSNLTRKIARSAWAAASPTSKSRGE